MDKTEAKVSIDNKILRARSKNQCWKGQKGESLQGIDIYNRRGKNTGKKNSSFSRKLARILYSAGGFCAVSSVFIPG